MIAIVDYGAGNITSVKRAVEYLGHRSVVTSDPADIEHADRIIVPGVGNFRATSPLCASNTLGDSVRRQISLDKQLLGICLGMQWLFQSSEEAPGISGLGALPGSCQPICASVKSPHVGWDELRPHSESRLLRGISGNAFVYFTHSYCAPVVEATVAVCDYGNPFSSAIERGNLFGVQFHPEKSGETGLAILENFCTC